MLPGGGRQWKLFLEEYWPWVGCKCVCANARGFPGVNPRMAADKCIIEHDKELPKISIENSYYI